MKNRKSTSVVVVLIAYVTTAWSQYPGVDTYSRISHQYGNDLPSDGLYLFQSVTSSDPLEIRLKRDANDKSQFLNHTSIVARIMNGMYLESGLINGKIPIDALVGELLDFGSASVDDIVNFKSDRVTAFTNKLKSISASLETKPEVDQSEKEALVWYKWWTLSSSVLSLNFNALPDSAKYLGELNKFVKIDLSSFEGAKINIDDVAKSVDDIELFLKIESPAGYKFNSVKGDIENLKHELDSFLKNVKTMTTKGPELIAFVWLKRGSEVYGAFEKVIEVFKLREKTKSFTSLNNPNGIEPNVKKVLEPMADAKSSANDILTMRNLKTRRAHSTIEHTHGLLNGFSDLKQLVLDVRSPWLATIMELDVPSLNSLSDGLQPLFKINEKVSELSEKLKTISSDNSYQSLMRFEEIQNEIVNLPSDSTDASVLKEYSNCRSGYASELNYKKEQSYTNNLKSFESGFAMVQSVIELDFKALQQEISQITKSIEFSKNTNPATEKKELDDILKDLKTSDKLAKLKKLMNDQKKQYFSYDTKTLMTTANSLVKEAATLADDTFKGLVSTEKTVCDCVKKFSDKSVKVSLAIQAVQKLKALDHKVISDVELVSSVVSELSKSLSNIKSIPETMKKDAKEVTTELNKMPDIEKNYESIGQTVRSLQYAFALKQLEPSIPSLKNVETVVQSEIHQISDPDKRKMIVQQWGDHRKHMSELENSIVTIKAFVSKIDVSKAKTLGEYSSPLKEMVTLSDAKMSANEKLVVLEVLISSATDPKVKSELEEAKKTQLKLSALDLEFTKRQSQFQSAPAAFIALQAFLILFLTKENEKKSAKQAEESNLIIILVIVGSAIFLIAGVTLLVIFIVKYCRKKRRQSRSRKWMNNRVQSRDAKIVRAYYRSCFNNLAVNDRQALVAVDELPNANLIQFDGFRYIAAITPNDDEGIVNFINCLVARRIKCSVSLQNRPILWIPPSNRSLRYGGYTVATTSHENSENGDIVEVKISISTNQGEHLLDMVHYELNGMFVGECPASHKVFVDPLRREVMRKAAEGPVIVYASDTDRPMKFIGLHYGYHSVLNDPNKTTLTMFRDLYVQRHGAFETLDSLYWIETGIIYMLVVSGHLRQEEYDVANELRQKVYVLGAEDRRAARR